MSQPALVFENVTRRFGKRVAVDALCLRVEPGTVLGLVGRNGSGKTTSLRLAHGVVFPDAGRIRTLGLDPVAQGIELGPPAVVEDHGTEADVRCACHELDRVLCAEPLLPFRGGLQPDALRGADGVGGHEQR